MVRGRRGVVALLFLAAFLLPVFLPQPSDAVPLSRQKAAAKAKAQRIRAQLEALDMALERVIEEYNLANHHLGIVEERVQKTTRELKIARYELRVARQTLRERAIAMYKQRPMDVLDVVFSAHSFDELMSQLRTVRELSAQDSRIVDDVENYEASVHEKRDRLVADRAEARKLLAQVKQKKASIETSLAQRRTLLKGVEKEIKRIEREEAEAAARAAAAAARAAAARAAAAAWRNPRNIPSGPAGQGHPEVIPIARRYLGIPYVYGAADPSVGFDCSGLVMYVYRQIGISLPHYSGYQQNMGRPVSLAELVPGDLVFKGYPVSYHVGMYAGGGSVIHAPHTGAVVSYTSLSGWHYAVRLP